MSKVILELSLLLDGFVAGPDVSPQRPLGRGGERLHEWMFAGRSPAESRRLENEHFNGIGALILGRRMADVGIGPWGEEPTFHAPRFRRHAPVGGDDRQAGRNLIHIRYRRHRGCLAASAAGRSRAGRSS
jgi:hypothetical protein